MRNYYSKDLVQFYKRKERKEKGGLYSEGNICKQDASSRESIDPKSRRLLNNKFATRLL